MLAEGVGFRDHETGRGCDWGGAEERVLEERGRKRRGELRGEDEGSLVIAGSEMVTEFNAGEEMALACRCHHKNPSTHFASVVAGIVRNKREVRGESVFIWYSYELYEGVADSIFKSVSQRR